MISMNIKGKNRASKQSNQNAYMYMDATDT